MYIRYYIYPSACYTVNLRVTYEHEVSFLSLLAQLAQEHFPGGQEHDSLHLSSALPLRQRMGRGGVGGWSQSGRLTYEQEDSPSFLAQHDPLPDPVTALLPQHEEEP
jgi:hypothetical protein